MPVSPFGVLHDQSQPSIDLLIRKLKSLEVQQRQRTEIRPSGDRIFDSVNSPLKVGNINIINMPRTLDKKSKHKVSEVAFEPAEDYVNPELTFAAAPLGTTVLSRN